MTTTTIRSGARFSMLPMLRMAKAWLACAIYSIALTIGLLGATAAHAGTTYSWVGTVDGLWSNANNWYPVGVPSAGDLLAFPSGSANPAMTNDFPAGTQFGAIAFNGGGYTLNGNAIVLTGGISGWYNNTINVPLTLIGPQTLDFNNYYGTIDVGSYNVSLLGSYNGAISMGSGSVSLQGSLNAPLSIGAGTFTTQYGAQINGPISGTGTVMLNGAYYYSNYIYQSHTFSGTVTVSDFACTGYYCYSPRVFSYGASFPNATMNLGNFYGNGTFGAFTAKGEVSLQDFLTGASVIVNTGNLDLESTFYIDIFGPGAGVGHDQFNVTGTVTLGANAALNVNLNPSFIPVVGQTFTLINNDGSDAVVGAFSGLPEGAILTLGVFQFRLSYVGGDGNDVTLTCTFAPNVWTGAVNDKWSVPGNWTAGTPSPGDALYFPQSPGSAVSTNDFPAGTQFGAIAFNGGGYTLNGNAIVLTGGISGWYNNTINVPLTLIGPQTLDFNNYYGTIDVGSYNVSLLGSYNGAISMGSGSVSLQGSLNAPLSIGAGTFTTQYGAQINGPISGTGTVMLNGAYYYSNYIYQSHTFSGTVTVSDFACTGYYCYSPRVFSYGASFPNATMNLGNFYGNGTFGAFTAKGEVSLQDFLTGASVIVNTGNLDLESTFYIDIFGPGAGVGHDQFNVTGTVTLGANAALNVNLNPSFIPVVGQTFTLINNDGSDAVVGAFSGLPEGAILTLGVFQFRLSYVGGDGNDVTLTCTFAPNVWTGAVNDKWSVPGNWTAGTPSPGDALYFPQSPGSAVSTNDFPAGTQFGAIAFNGGGYTLNGNAIVLTGGISGWYNNTINVPLTLIGPQTLDFNNYYGTIDVGSYNVSLLGSYNGAISMGSGSVSLQGSLNAPLSIGAGTFTTQYGAQINGPISGTGTVMLNGAYYYSNYIYQSHTFSGTVTVSDFACTGYYCYSPRVFSYGASFPNATMNLGNFYGNGTFGAFTAKGEVSLQDFLTGASVIVNTGNLDLESTFYIDIFGPGAGVGHDQFNVTGTVTLGANAALSPSMSTGYVPTQGEVYVLVNNDGTDAVIGSFLGTPEGHVFTMNGVYQFRLSYLGGDGNDITLTSLNGKPATSISLASSINPSSAGQSVTFTASLGGSFGNPTGSVTFKDGSSTLGTYVVVAGSATITTSTLSSGTHSITAQYAGDSTYGGGISPVVLQVVNKYATTTTLASSSNPSTSGNPVSFTATVTNGATGSVTFKDGATVLATVGLSGNTAAFSTSSLPVGTHSITATYGGDAAYESSMSAALSQEVQSSATAPGAPTIGLATPGNGQATIAFTPPASNGNSPITGYTVTCTPGPKSASGGSSPITVTGLTNGAVYSCSVTATNAIGTSNASGNVSVTPGIAPSITSGAPSGGTINVAYSHAYAATGSPAPTFSLASGSLPTGLSLSSNGALAGTPSAVGTFSGVVVATNAIGSATQAFSITIAATAPGAPTIGSATAANTLATVTFTPPASNGGSAITGYTVTSSPGGITASGTASPMTVTGLTNGTSYTFTVRATNATATSAPSTASNAVTPKSPAATSIGTITPEPSVTGQSYSVSVAVSATTGIASGSVVVKDDLGATCTIASLASAAGSCSLASAAAGVRTITATYAGAAAFLGSSATRSHTVNAANTKTDLASTPNPSTQGSPVTFTTTVSVSGSGKGTPTGTVMFTTGSGNKATTLGTATLNASGVATFATSALPVGNNSVVAIYGGDANFNSSKGSVNQSVKKN